MGSNFSRRWMRGDELTGCDAPNIPGLDPAPNGEDACAVVKPVLSVHIVRGQSWEPLNKPLCCVLITCC